MPQKVTFVAKPRTLMGKKVGQIRRGSSVPANISGEVEQSIPVEIDRVSFAHLYDQVGDTGLFYLQVEGEKKDRPVLVSDIQVDPLSDAVLHVVFRQVNLNEKVKAEVPVEVIGEFAVKGALLATLHDSVEVEALPQDFPEKFEIDASTFTEIGQMVTFRQLSFDPSKVTLEIEEEQLDSPVVMVQEVKEEVEVVETPVAEGDVAGAPAEAAATEKTEDAK